MDDTIPVANASKLVFSTQEIEEAADYCNFNKGLGPDCFDGNILNNDEWLRGKII